MADLADEWGWRIWRLNPDASFPAKGRKLSGAIVDCLPDDELATRLRRQKCPTVRLGGFVHPKDHLLPAVLPDLIAQGRLAAEHFAERRFAHIAFVGHIIEDPDFLHKPLLTAFCERAKELGVETSAYAFIEPDDQKLMREKMWERRRLRLRNWLRTLPKPVGLFAVGDGMGLELLGTCEKEGIEVPDEVAVLGRGNSTMCRMTWTPLSSVRTDKLRHIREAMRTLKQLMDGKTLAASRIIIPPAGIVERQSTDTLAVSHPLAVRAVRYIWDHVCEDPSVNEMADALGVQRRSLERLFREHVGAGIKAEIRRRRLQFYCRELRASDEPIATLSAKMGFWSTETMHRQFVKAMGTTPNRYRKMNHPQ